MFSSAVVICSQPGRLISHRWCSTNCNHGWPSSKGPFHATISYGVLSRDTLQYRRDDFFLVDVNFRKEVEVTAWIQKHRFQSSRG